MSWIFGFKQPQQGSVPQDGASLENDNRSQAAGSAQQQQEIGAKTAFSFDSTALERAAQAAKSLEKSSNAKQALELSRLQEQIELRMASIQSENIRVAEEERRKTLIEETKHSRARADYQDQLARKRQEEDAAIKARLQEESLRRQEESIKKQEAMRKATIEHELSLRHKLDLERIETEVKAKTKSARENRDVNLEMMRASEEERRKTIMEQIRTAGGVLGAGFQEFIGDRTKIATTVGGLTLLAIGWYSAKRGTDVVARYVQARLGKPSLIRETSRMTPFEVAKHPYSALKQIFRRGDDPLKGIILSPKLESQLRDVAITTSNTKRNYGLFRNVLLHGPPGTGKTMFAKSLARHSGLDYAIMTGGDVAPMGRDGVSAIHKIFDWAQTSRKGLVLFIDEADAFLRKRSTEQISEDMRATLNAFLFRTGEQSRKFMLVVASNQPEQFDWAVNDRLDELVEFDLPGDVERERLLLQYFKEYIADPATSGSRRQRLKLGNFEWIPKMKEIAEKTKGMSGRELSKLVFGWQASAYASEDGILTSKMIDEYSDQVIKQHKRKMEWLAAERGLEQNNQILPEQTTITKGKKKKEN
ncbi:unnamed protein product [Meloidogyne enterolobii]|uniref:Uncharacterized protein n=1 Tax=Meloidogyne enterolobii TaxID=390850 RepID=A0ACB0XP88_MELEN